MPAASPERPDIDAARLRSLLSEGWGEVVVTDRTESTNVDLLTAGRAGAPAWTVHTTNHQAAGRGRLDRTFTMPRGSGIAVSVLLRPEDVPPARWTWLPLLAGVAVVDLAASVGVEAGLKWPNDVLVDSGRKLCGILVERFEVNDEPAAVVGMGVNVSLAEEELPVPTATSLWLEDATSIDRTELIARLAERLRHWVGVWETDFEQLASVYRERCLTLGHEVRILREGHEDVTGRAEEIDGYGCLVVDGTSWSAGDVLHVRTAP